MQGWLKLHRELLEKPIWTESTPEQKTILITLLMMANHSEKEWEWKGKSYKAKPGQFVTSIPSIVEKCGKGVTVQNVRTALKRFKKYDFLTDESTNRNRLITIVNWAKYQSQDDEDNSKSNRQLTGNQQAANRQLTPNKNDKNVKNDKEGVVVNNPFSFFQKNGFGMLTPFLIDEMNHWIDGGYFDDPEDVITEALKESLRANVPRWSYANKILMNWSDKGIRTAAQARAHIHSLRKGKVVSLSDQEERERRLREKQWEEGNKYIEWWHKERKRRQEMKKANGG